MQKKEDLGAFTIPCNIGLLQFVKALREFGASIHLMPFSIYKKVLLEEPKPNMVHLLMVNKPLKSPNGVLPDVLVKVESFIFWKIMLF